MLNGCKKEPDPISLPTVVTASVSEITQQSAIIRGMIAADGGAEVTACGFCWSTNPNPSIGDSKTFAGKGPGVFFNLLTGLTPNTTYYVRSYATNSVGIAYGNEITFTSLELPPSVDVILSEIVSFSFNSAIVTGHVSNGQNGFNLTGSGVCWNTSGNPTTADSRALNATSSGSFSSNLTGLTGRTTYFVRPYAISDNGSTIYGNEISFTTLANIVNLGTEFPGGGRTGTVSFAIGTKGYFGLGISDSDFPANDLWEWNPATELWTQVASFLGNGGGSVCGFSIGAKGYVMTTGNWQSDGYLANEFWEYDPITNAWTKKASLPTTPGRGSAVGFSIGTKGYIGIGYKEVSNGFGLEYFNDFWEWDQATDLWTRKADFPGIARSGAVGFSIGNKGYIGTGWTDTSLSNEFWEWDQATNVWIRKADFAGFPRGSGVGFSIGTKGYIGTGYIGYDTGDLSQDIWEWDQMANEWKRVADYAGGPRSSAFGVSIGNKAYIGTGFGNSGYLNDFGEYDPTI